MNNWKVRATVGTAGTLLDAILATVRFESEGDRYYREFIDAGKPVIYALWHGRLLPLGYRHRQQGVIGLISRSKDGEYLTGALERWGFGAVRGSSSRGGMEALRGLVRETRRGRSLAITPDGPRGPRQKLKSGVLVAAQLSGLPIIPVSATADRGWWPERWDRFLVPKPFAHVRIRYAPPVWVPRDADERMLNEIGSNLEAQLNQMTAELDAG